MSEGITISSTDDGLDIPASLRRKREPQVDVADVVIDAKAVEEMMENADAPPSIDTTLLTANDLVNSAAASDAGNLVLYNNACRALAEATRVDEIAKIEHQAVAIKLYAQQANNPELLEYAVEIRLRAQRKGGEVLRQMAARGEREVRGGDRKSKAMPQTLKLANLERLGVKKHQSAAWQKLADLPDEEFEACIANTKARAAGIKAKFGGARPDRGPILRLIAWVKRGAKLVEDLGAHHSDMANEVSKALKLLEPSARKLRDEVEQNKAGLP